MTRRYLSHPRVVAGEVFLLVWTSLCSAHGLGQSVTVSMKLQVTGAAKEHKHSMKLPSNMDSGGVVAWLTPLDNSLPQPQRSAPVQGYRLVQKNKQFTPHLLVVPTGSSIDFPNQDPFFHNVFSLFNGKRFDLGLYESGSHRSVRFDREGVSYIFCNIHPEMGAVVVSLRTPYYGVSSNDGILTLTGLQPGEYTLKFWAEGIPANDLAAASRKVKISSEDLTLGTISLRRTASSMDHKNKFGEEYKPTTMDTY